MSCKLILILNFYFDLSQKRLKQKKGPQGGPLKYIRFEFTFAGTLPLLQK